MKRFIEWVRLLFTKKKPDLNKDLTATKMLLKGSDSLTSGITDSDQGKTSDKPTPNIKTMTKGEEIVEIARKEIGYSESPDNSNNTKYGIWFSLNFQPWCAMFVSWCYDQAGVPLEAIPFKHGFAGVQNGVDHFKTTGQLTDNPVAGDIVMYDWQGDGHYDHTGIFVRTLDDTHFEAIEGNTSVANQSNGGTVMLRTRQKHNVLFAHPNVLNE